MSDSVQLGEVVELAKRMTADTVGCAAVSEERKTWNKQLNRECLIQELAEKLLVATFRTQYPQSYHSCIFAAESLVNEFEARRNSLMERQPA